MRQLAEATPLEQRRRLLIAAADRCAALAQMEEAVASAPPRSWASPAD
jgi:hypothetical protein